MTSRYCSHHTRMWTISPAAGGLQATGASDLIGEPAMIVVHLRPAVRQLRAYCESARNGSISAASSRSSAAYSRIERR